MTSTPVTLLLKRSGNSSDRPSGVSVGVGEPAVCFGASDPGLYVKDSVGNIRKVGPTHYGTTAPNSSPVGLAGNSVGEQWVDSSTSSYYLRVWTGSAWQKIGALFADSSTIAGSAGSASFATVAGSTIMASGAVLASGSITASGAISASGAVIASGAISASGAVIASGAISASGAIVTSSVLPDGLPAASTSPSGSLAYLTVTSGSFPSGLYVRAADAWALV
jgi:hypothetical protein